MTIYDLIYTIGCAVAFLMAFFGCIRANEKKARYQDGYFLMILLMSFMASFLSWGLPIFWICKEIYERKFKK